MTVKFTNAADKGYKKLPFNIQKKADKQFSLLLSNYRHPSLGTGKMGVNSIFEARINTSFTLPVILRSETTKDL